VFFLLISSIMQYYDNMLREGYMLLVYM